MDDFMDVIMPRSKTYLVRTGKHVTKTCIIVNDVPGLDYVDVAFCDNPTVETGLERISRCDLCEHLLPGWEIEPPQKTLTLAQYLKVRGTGDDRLRTESAAHPRTLKQGDLLISREWVSEYPRAGHNNSVLIHFRMGWVEIASRFAIALFNSKSFRLSPSLVAGDKLITGCLVDKDSYCKGNDWTTIFVDGGSFEVPSCIPLALAQA